MTVPRNGCGKRLYHSLLKGCQKWWLLCLFDKIMFCCISIIYLTFYTHWNILYS